MTDTARLTEAIRDGGIRSINFFNGRLLTGEDLRAEQQAGRAARALLGRAIGAGVAEGLMVEPTVADGQMVIHITAGVAINRQGQALSLAHDINLSLTEPPDSSVRGTAGFEVCGEAGAGLYVAGEEFYVLTIAPADYNEGRALVSGLASATAACNIKLIVETAQFRLLPLHLALERKTGDEKRTRNLAAHAMFGAIQQRDTLANPFGVTSDTLPRPAGLTGCDVALALIRVVDNKLVFADAWAVRRACATLASTAPWEGLFGDSARHRSDAMLYQFQTQLTGIPSGEQGGLQAKQHFRYLPPVGFVPSTFSQFFTDLKIGGPLPITPDVVGPMVQVAMHSPPLDLDAEEQLWRFEVQGGTGGTPTYDIFTRNYQPDLLGRYNLSRMGVAIFGAAGDT